MIGSVLFQAHSSVWFCIMPGYGIRTQCLLVILHNVGCSETQHCCLYDFIEIMFTMIVVIIVVLCTAFGMFVTLFCVYDDASCVDTCNTSCICFVPVVDLKISRSINLFVAMFRSSAFCDKSFVHNPFS